VPIACGDGLGHCHDDIALLLLEHSPALGACEEKAGSRTYRSLQDNPGRRARKFIHAG